VNFSRTAALLIVAFLFHTAGVAQIIWEKQVGNKTITCMHTGLQSYVNECDPHRYAYAFVGSIAAIQPAAGDEKKLQILPEELFQGTPANPLTVFTSQVACLPELKVGDRWLFLLWQEQGKPIVVDFYSNESRPVADAREEIETFRRLRTIGEFAILRGRVVQEVLFDGEPVTGARVAATRKADNSQFFATSGGDGRYEFPLLPAGDYSLTSEATGSFLPDQTTVRLDSGVCRDLALQRSRHAQVSGYVRKADGSPMAKVDVMLLNAHRDSWDTTTSNDRENTWSESTCPAPRPGSMPVQPAFRRRARRCITPVCRAARVPLS
jgi:hypothetical protein